MPSLAVSLGALCLVAGPWGLKAQPLSGQMGVGPPPESVAATSSPGRPYAAAWVNPSPAAAGSPHAARSMPSAGVPLSPPRSGTSLPLPPPGCTNRQQPRTSGGLPPPVTVIGSLAVALGAFFLVAWLMRRAAPQGSIALPDEVFEVLGRAPMAARQQVHLLRCGRKLLLVSVTPAGAETLTEITDPDEVDRLAGLCQQARPNSATAVFRQVLGQLTAEQSAGGSLLGRLRGKGNQDALFADLAAGHGASEGRDV